MSYILIMKRSRLSLPSLFAAAYFPSTATAVNPLIAHLNLKVNSDFDLNFDGVVKCEFMWDVHAAAVGINWQTSKDQMA